ncbi:hypothetical protein V8C26DRAFT_428510 [Trichoderma gracile]
MGPSVYPRVQGGEKNASDQAKFDVLSGFLEAVLVCFFPTTAACRFLLGFLSG